MRRAELVDARSRALELRHRGVPVDRIAAQFGVTEDTVRRWTKSEFGRRIYRLTLGQVEWARELMREGCPIGEVAESLGVTREAVRRVTGMSTPFEWSVELREMRRALESIGVEEGGV